MVNSKSEEPFNPLEKRHLGESVASALLSQPAHALPLAHRFEGAGVYAVYYKGDHRLYQSLNAYLSDGTEIPIYVGKAIPAGGRKGGLGAGVAAGPVLYKRISEHCESIRHASDLSLDDFYCRYLVADDIWIPLGESLLIEKFAPLWNKVVDGFGNHTPGAGRYEQQRSAWDVIHQGRPFADKLKQSKKTIEDIENAIGAHFSGLHALKQKSK